MSQAPQSPAVQTLEPAPGFDPLVFWIKHKSSILAIAALTVVGLAGYGFSEWNHARKTAEAAEAFGAARSPEELARFASSHQGLPLAGNAQLLLAHKLRSEKKFDEAIKTLREFLAQSPTHPLAPAAHLSIATTLEQQGKSEEALAAYRSLAVSDVRGFATPAAWLRAARILKTQGKHDEARVAYENLQSQFPRSAFANDALLEAQEIAPKPAPAPSENSTQTPPAPAPVAPAQDSTSPAKPN
jgi:predicted negative regulator of RcsB-dependent stress response